MPGAGRFIVNPLTVRPRPELLPSSGRAEQRKAARRFSMAVKLFIGSLSFSTSSDRLREAFARVGAVESASVVTDRDTGRSRGFGFVEIATAEEPNNPLPRLHAPTLHA